MKAKGRGFFDPYPLKILQKSKLVGRYISVLIILAYKFITTLQIIRWGAVLQKGRDFKAFLFWDSETSCRSDGFQLMSHFHWDYFMYNYAYIQPLAWLFSPWITNTVWRSCFEEGIRRFLKTIIRLHQTIFNFDKQKPSEY